MVVGEPSLMSGDFGEKDEELIIQFENIQYDPAVQGDPNSFQPPLMDNSSGLGVPPFSGPPDEKSPKNCWSVEIIKNKLCIKMYYLC